MHLWISVDKVIAKLFIDVQGNESELQQTGDLSRMLPPFAEQ